MIQFNDLISKIESNSKRKYNSIPHDFGKYNEILPGVMRGTYTIITANSGVGKSKYARSTYLYDVINFITAPEVIDMFKVKIFYFALEESKLKFSLSYIAKRLKEIYGLSYSVRELLSIIKKENNLVSPEIIEKIKLCEKDYEKLTEYVEVVDYIHHGFGIYKYVLDWLGQNGTLEYITLDNNIKVLKSYTPNDPEQYVIVITDQVNLLVESKNENDLRMAIHNFSNRYCMRLKNICNCAIINLQQQEAAKEKQIYTQSGESVISKLEPSLDGLAENKATQRDADIVLGIFDPLRFNISNYYNYDLTKIKLGTFRSIIKLKDRDDFAPVRMAFYFDAISETYRPLPSHTDLLLPENRHFLNK